jgi:hypothetical protein
MRDAGIARSTDDPDPGSVNRHAIQWKACLRQSHSRHA